MEKVNIPVENTDTWLESKAKGCPICKGGGVLYPTVNGVVDYSKYVYCKCVKDELKKLKQESLIKSCNFPIGVENMTLENFNPYGKTKIAYDAAKEMAANTDKTAWLTFIGNNGSGKTHLGIGVCRVWLKSGIPARYVLTSLLFDELREGFRCENTENSYARKFEYYCNIPLLMLDDCGIESRTDWVQEKLETIIDYRLTHNLSLIVTSNLSLEQMPPRMASRLIRHNNSKVVYVQADDYKAMMVK